MSELAVKVSVDERVRLVMAVLAATDWPVREQGHQPHAVHQHSKQTRQFVVGFEDHAAVIGLNQAVESDISLDDLFAAALRCGWPDFEPAESLPPAVKERAWVEALPDFYRATAIDGFWAEHALLWEEAADDLKRIFQGSQIIQFLGQLRDEPMKQSIVVMPSIVYPMLTPILADTASELFFILPPAKAWGESPPWPFGEDPGWVITQTCWYLTPPFMAATLSQMDEKPQALLRHAVVTLCLEREFDEAEAMAYLVRSKKEFGLPRLPLVVEDLRDYLAAPGGRSILELMS